MNAIVASSGRRKFFVGLNTGLTTDGLPDGRFVDFYRDRSSRELSCAIVGNVVVPRGHGSNPSTPTIVSHRAWADVATAIHSRGTLPGIQLATTWVGYTGAREFRSKNSDDIIDDARNLVKKLGQGAIADTIEAFRVGAEIAIEQGFRHIQVHAAHGYLPNLLLDDRINPLAESARTGFAGFAHGLQTRGIETSLRISMRTGNEALDGAGREQFLDAMIALPFDFVDLSSGFYNVDKRLIYPSRPDTLAERLSDSLAVVEKYPGRQFIVSGHVTRTRTEFPPNAHLGLCRDLIANPNFLTDTANGCKDHGKCHYFSRGDVHITCARWAEAQ